MRICTKEAGERQFSLVCCDIPLDILTMLLLAAKYHQSDQKRFALRFIFKAVSDMFYTLFDGR